jgi:hypothetical protein
VALSPPVAQVAAGYEGGKVYQKVDESELRKPKGRQLESFAVDGDPLLVNTGAAAADAGGGGRKRGGRATKG